jgi:hypothetical protein
MNSYIYWIIAFILNDILFIYSFFLWWDKMNRKAYGLHLVPCDNCGEVSIQPQHVTSIRECPSCHVCEQCGKTVICENCVKPKLVRMEVDGIYFCDNAGCRESYFLKKDLEKKQRTTEKVQKIIKKIKASK